MHFYVSSFSAAASLIVLVLHLSCFAGNITAQNINEDSSTIVSDDDIVFTTVPPVIDAELTLMGEASLEVSNAAKQPLPEDSRPAAVFVGVNGVTEKSQSEIEYDVQRPSSTESPATEAPVTSPVSRWVQKVPKAQPGKSRLSGFRSLESSATSQKNAGKQIVAFGQIIANVLYGAPWSASGANPQCANDMQSYNLHMQNFTLWAAKSKSYLFINLFHKLCIIIYTTQTFTLYFPYIICSFMELIIRY